MGAQFYEVLNLYSVIAWNQQVSDSKALPGLMGQPSALREERGWLLSHLQLFATPWTGTCQAPLSMGFSRQEYWSGLPFPSPGNLPNPGIEPRYPALQVDSGILVTNNDFLWVLQTLHSLLLIYFNSSLLCVLNVFCLCHHFEPLANRILTF